MEIYKVINRVRTRVLTWGNPFSCEGKDVIICITGNPGIVDFYHEFGTELHESSGLAVCVIGQAGHDIIPHEKPMILKGEEHLFNLEGQIGHKLDLINNFIDKQSQIHLIGHSIGAWLIIELLDKHPSVIKRVSSINLLFPTIQEMALTKNGVYLNRVIRNMDFFLMILLTFLNILPQFVLEYIALAYLKFNDLPSHYTRRLLKYVDKSIIEKVLFLAYCEMDIVTTLNTQGIERVKHLINIIYGENDGWVPLKYMTDLKEIQPQLKMTKVPYTHEFVLKSSVQVAKMVSDDIYTKCNVVK